MNNIEQKGTEETRIQGLLDHYLAFRSSLKSSVGETSLHLDEDSLAAFVEGGLTEREEGPLVRHLVDCGFCRNKTAELLTLNLELAADEATAPVQAAEPSKISEVLSGLLSKIFGSADQAVFAHKENEDEKKDGPDKDKENN